MKRKPLAVGNEYFFPKCPGNGFKILFIAFPNTHPYDEGLPGVGLKWIGNSNKSYFYPCSYEESFWEYLIFKDAVSEG